MARPRSRFVAALVAAGLGVGLYYAWPFIEQWRSNGLERLTNQLWVQRLPTSPQDLVGHLVLLEQDGNRAGVAGPASRWRMHLELFVWRLEDRKLRTRFPQDDARASFDARTWRCEGEAPAPFDLCLELARAGNKIRFFSRRDWEVKVGTELPADMVGFKPAIAALETALASPQTVPIDEAPDSPTLTAIDRP